jgi:hypothetical protein
VDRKLLVLFQIQNVLKGMPLDQKTVEVRTGLGGGDCGVSFRVAETYLVYAGRLEDGGLSTNTCSRTAALEKAKDEIPLIESFLAGKRLTAILGTVIIHRDQNPDLPRSLRSFDRFAAEGIEIELQGARQSFKTTVDWQGRFRVWNVPEGTYRIRPAVHSWYQDRDLPQTFSIKRGACSVDAFVLLRAHGRVDGRVLNSNGQPVAVGTAVSLYDAHDRTRATSVISTRVGLDGRYSFQDLPPGRYILAVGNDFYGGGTDRSKARIVDLTSRPYVTDIDIRLRR